jgi:hypothetical protein
MSNDHEYVRKGLTGLFLELNFNPRIMDFQEFYRSLKDKDFFPSLSILFLKIGGPFLTFETFKAFFENLYLAGLLEFDMEEYCGIVEVRFLTMSKLNIEKLVSQIKIVSAISLIQVFSHLSGMLTGGPITWLDLYNRNPSFKSFFEGNGKDKMELRNIVENTFREYGVAVENNPHLSFTFPPNWGNTKTFLSFVSKLVSTIGFEMIRYVSDTSEEEGPVKPVELFKRLTRLFSGLKCFQIELITDLNFLRPLYDVSQTSPGQKKQIFALLVRFCFIIDNGIATPHPYFHVHVEHFVVAFMKIIGSSLEGVRVEGTIKSGPKWVHEDGKKRIVCSSVATGKDCRKRETCRFLHSDMEYGIMTTHCGKVFIVCRENAKFDRTPPTNSILCYKFDDGMVSFNSTDHDTRGCSAKSETRAVAGGFSAKPEPHAVARGGSAKSETRAVAGGCSANPELCTVARGGSANPELCAIAREGSAKPEPHAVARGGSANPELCAVARGGDEDYDPNDPRLKKRFSLYPLDNSVHGSMSDRVMQRFSTLSSPDDMALLAAFVVHNMVRK